jgi:DNA-binding LytR/AlgR family response regulator
MISLKIMVCDDEESAFLQIREHVLHYGIARNLEIEMGYCATGENLLCTTFNYDVLFLDIMLGDGDDGIAVGKRLRSNGNTALYVLTTSRMDRALDGYEANVLRYLVKPVSREKVFGVLDAAIDTLEYDRKIITVRFKYQTNYIHVKDIIYVESYLRKRHIVAKTGKYQTTAPWLELMEQLSDYPYFFSPRKTHLINFSHVVAQSQVGLTMENGKLIRFAEGKHEKFIEAFSKYLDPRLW